MPTPYNAPNNIHPIIGGLVNVGTTPIDGDKTVAVLPAMNGGCYIDMNQFIVLDGNAIRLVNTGTYDVHTMFEMIMSTSFDEYDV
jgi:mRNA-degrading endonuclease HigB of HigAB toxin-antitoxin module